MTTIRAALVQGTQDRSFGVPVDLDAEGLAIVLDVPAGVELARAELRLTAPGDSEEVELQPAASTSAGALVPGKAVDWIAADWGSRRPLTYLELTAGDTPSSATKGRLKVAEGGPWFPPLPFEYVPFNQGVRLLGITATRLLVEPVNEQGGKLPRAFSAIKLRVAARPPALLAALADAAPFFHHPVLMGAGEVLVLAEELTSALAGAWPASGGTLSVSLRSVADAKLHSVRLSLAACTLTRAWDSGAESIALPIAPGEQAEAAIAVSDGGPLKSLSFTVSAAPRAETVPLLPKPAAAPLIGHLIGAGFRAAQAMSTQAADAVLVGIDIYVQPLTSWCTGTVAIHADTFGRPADAPFDKALAALLIQADGDAPWAARWVSLDLPVAVPVKDQVFWVVLDLPQGEALWLLGTTPPADGQTGTALRGARIQAGGDRVWREQESPSYPEVASAPSAYARPRFRATGPAPAPTVSVRWGQPGSAELAAPVGAGGRVTLDQSALAALSRPSSGDTGLHVIVRSAVAAVVTLSDLELRIPWSREFP